MPKMAIQFMSDCLKVDPKQRLTVMQALKHPYFKGLNGEFVNLKNSHSVQVFNHIHFFNSLLSQRYSAKEGASKSNLSQSR